MGVILRQGIKNTIAGYLGILIGFISLIVIQPHFLTPEELGLTRILYSFSILISVFVPMGIGNATIKYFPGFKDAKSNNHGFFAFMNLFPVAGFVLATSLILIFKGFILNQYRSESPLFLEYFNYVFPLIFFNSFIAVFNIYCNANYKTTVPVYINEIYVRIITILIVSIYFLKWINLDQFITLFVCIYGLQLVLLAIYIYHFDKPVFRIDWKIFREKKMFQLVKFGMLLWFAGIASIGLKYFDSIMIGKYMPLSFVGIYTIAAFIPTVIEAPLNAFEKIAAAKISFAWNDNDKKQIHAIYHKSSLYLFLFGGFLFLLINLNIHSLLTFLPESYRQGEIVVFIISFGTLFNMATGLNAPILFNSDKYRYGAIFLIALSVIVLALQMILIPRLGITGAALATSAASVIYNSMLFISVYRFFGLQPFDRKNIRVLVTIITVFLVVFLIPEFSNKIFDIALRTLAISLLYFVLVYTQKIVPEFHHYLPWHKKKEDVKP